MGGLVTYLRVSTSQQGKSGLGIEAQREALARLAQAEGLDIVAEHLEVETGRDAPTITLAERWRIRQCPLNQNAKNLESLRFCICRSRKH